MRHHPALAVNLGPGDATRRFERGAKALGEAEDHLLGLRSARLLHRQVEAANRARHAGDRCAAAIAEPLDQKRLVPQLGGGGRCGDPGRTAAHDNHVVVAERGHVPKGGGSQARQISVHAGGLLHAPGILYAARQRVRGEQTQCLDDQPGWRGPAISPREGTGALVIARLANVRSAATPRRLPPGGAAGEACGTRRPS